MSKMSFKKGRLSVLILVVSMIGLCSGLDLDVQFNGSILSEGEFRSIVSYPYMVAVIMDQDVDRRCGGALISNQHVLTAAHCADEASVEVIFGTSDLTLGGVNYHRIAIEDKDITVHPSYDRDSLANNIAVLKFPEFIELNDRIAPIELASKDAGQFAQEIGILTTWGKEQPKMKAVDVLIISNHECRRKYGKVSSEELCAETEEEDNGFLGWIFGSKFKGNPGDPMVTLNDNILVGLATKTKRQPYDAPLRLTRISSHREWIDTIVGESPASTTI